MQVRTAERGGTRLVVPPTPTGVAAALTHLGAPNRDRSPGATGIVRNRRLPSIAVSETADPTIANPDAEVVVEVPDRLDDLFVLAPLAHHLGAEVTIGTRESSRIRIPGRGIEHDLPATPDLQDAVADLHDRVVALDRLAVGDGPAAPFEGSAVDREWLASATPGERLETYLDGALAGIDPGIRGYDLAMYVDPSPAHVPALSHLLERPCAIYLPNATSLERDELIQRSLEDFYRSTTYPDVSVDLVSPTRRRGSVRGWLAEGVAVDAFKATMTAYENRIRRADLADERRVTVVLNDPEMRSEGPEVERIYRDRAGSLGMDVTVERGLGRAELAAVLDRPTSFLHYVGHCDEAGLRCADGHLAADDLERSGARTFLLNACGSYHEGHDLVRKGSIAGAVTLAPVLDEQAAKVGVAFAGLVTRGFCIERALRIARRRAIMNKDYVVVGDGTYALSDGSAAGGRIERRGEDHFRFVLDGEDGDSLAVTTTRSELISYLRRANAPLVYEGCRQPASAIYRQLATEDGAATN